MLAASAPCLRPGLHRRSRSAATRLRCRGVAGAGALDESLARLDALLVRPCTVALCEALLITPLQALARASEASEGGEAEAQAVALARALRDEQQILRGFGRGRLAPKRDYTLADLRLNKMDPSAFLSPRDTTLEGVRSSAVLALSAGAACSVAALHPDTSQLLAAGLAALTALTVDQVGNGGAGEALVLDALGRWTSALYRSRVLRHESGHFLIAYLVGILPRGYSLSAWQALLSEGRGNVQAGCSFCDAEFRAEVSAGKLSSASLDAFTCIALAGVASEYLAFGQAEGGLDDLRSLDSLLAALGFTQMRADSEVRFAVLSVVLMLRRHTAAHDALAAKMGAGASVGECIRTLESCMAADDM